MTIDLTEAELAIIDDCITESNYTCLAIITGNEKGDKAWAERRHIELVELRSKIDRQTDRVRATKTPDEAWENAINEVRKAWGDDE